ncbi:MFS transporter [Nakamurella antarctica]|uniref:MFS transporter n=1 Tax=Nakamurella antarctica TaxID=1902245 RepID=UPI0030D4999C
MSADRRHHSAPGLPRDFRSLLVAWAASLSGDGLRVVALPLLALATNPSPAAVAAVAAIASLPWLLIALPAGAIVDRLSPNRVIIAAHLVRAALTLGLVAVVVAHSVNILVLCVFGFLITAAETFADGATQSLMLHVVPTQQLEQANARFVTVETLALDLAGPLLAGLLFILQPWLPFAVSGLAFVVSAGLIRRIRAVAAATLTAGEGVDGSHVGKRSDLRARLQEIRDGLVFLFRHRVLRTLVLTVAVLAVANAATDAVLVLYARTSLNMSEAVYPTLLAAYSVGTLIATVIVARLSRRFASSTLLGSAIVGLGLSMLVMGMFVTPAIALSAYVLLGIFGGTWNVLSATRRQRHTPRAIVARVSSAFRVVAWGVIPVGAALGGGVASQWSVPTVFVSAGVLTLLLAVVVIPALARQERLAH